MKEMDAAEASRLLRLYEATLDLIRKEKKEKFIKALLDSICEDVYLASGYAKYWDLDYATAISRIEEETQEDLNDYID
jgi:hypothetical protein